MAAAVAGNPRVVERNTLLTKLLVLGFTSISSLLGRVQRVWGRILTVSGVVAMFGSRQSSTFGMFQS